jgi:hypothetical protein
MEDELRLIGLALPNNGTILRLKVLVAGGIGGVGAGLLFMTSGLDGAIVRGAALAGCGVALIAISIRSLLRELALNELQRTKLQEQSEAEARREVERQTREASCNHRWSANLDRIDVDDSREVCVFCGAARAY